MPIGFEKTIAKPRRVTKQMPHRDAGSTSISQLWPKLGQPPLNAVIQSSPMTAKPKAMTAIVTVKKNEKVRSERKISSSMG